MADVPMGGAAGLDPARPSFTTFTNWAGAAVSLALIVGVGVWGYQILMRDVSGVPVVQAIDGPMRVAPDKPGGIAADHQGLSVNQVAGQGTAQPTPDQLLLAPSQSGISPTDAPGVAVRLPSGLEASDDALETAQLSPLIPNLDRADNTQANPSQDAAIQALADQLAAGVEPLSAPEPAPNLPKPVLASADAAVPQAPPAPQAAPVPEPVKVGLAKSLRPQLRPKALAKSARAAAEAAATVDVDPASIPSGTRLVQLGAYDSPKVARDEWDRLAKRFDVYLVDKKRVIQRATSGGRVFYRLRAMGFGDLSDARQFCSALVAEKADCIPVVWR